MSSWPRPVGVESLPVYLITRDRWTDLELMVSWLEVAGQQRITFLDNASTYPPLLAYLEKTPHEVVRLDENVGHLALFWQDLAPEPPFFMGDPDTPFLGPFSGLERLHEVAQKYPERDKVGMGLSLDGVPTSLPSYRWEQQMWEKEIEQGVYDAPVDTTFSIYNRHTTDIWNALRIGEPHVLRHSSWFSEKDKLSEEDAYYLEHRKEGPWAGWWGM